MGLRTINAAAEQGNLEMVKYCVANECPIDEEACAYAAENGHLEVLKYLREEVKATWDSRTASWAAAKGHLHILEYLVERKYDQYSVYACAFAAENGHFDCLKYLHETAKAPWDLEPYERAREQPTRVFTIPPRQQLSITIVLAIRRRSVTHVPHVVNTCTDTQREKERERDTKNTQNTEERKNSQIAAAFLLLYIIT